MPGSAANGNTAGRAGEAVPGGDNRRGYRASIGSDGIAEHIVPGSIDSMGREGEGHRGSSRAYMGARGIDRAGAEGGYILPVEEAV